MLLKTEIIHTYTCDFCRKKLMIKTMSENGIMKKIDNDTIIKIKNPFYNNSNDNDSLFFCSSECVVMYIWNEIDGDEGKTIVMKSREQVIKDRNEEKTNE